MARRGAGGRVRGFTAVELLIACVLLALIASVVWPGVSRVRARWAVAGARDAVAAW
ncbi:MAG: prepilin-type N-terminal cleavage/methylation domain-containing protein, partial [Gemmatimonadota bacterium]